MKKSFLLGSVIAAMALLSGCGSGSSGDSDTTAPEFTNTTYSFDVNEGEAYTVALATNETGVTFTEDSAEADIDGSSLEFDAPNFNAGGDNNYTVNVVAKDEAGNASAAKAFTFNVKAVISDSYEFNSSYVADVDDKDFVTVGDNLEGLSGLLWDDTVSDRMTYAEAEAYCEAKGTGWRIPTRAEFLNVLDYSKVSGTSSLIDDDFTNYSANTVEVSWVENLTDDKYVVHIKDGTDYLHASDLNYTVLCVYGDKNSTAHTFTQDANGDFQDDVTGLTWKTINADPGNTPSNYAVAEAGCTGEWNLPTINQLRSIIDYNTNTITADIASGTPPTDYTYYIWSSTQAEDYQGADAHYTVLLEKETNTTVGVISDADTATHYYTCVKR